MFNFTFNYFQDALKSNFNYRDDTAKDKDAIILFWFLLQKYSIEEISQICNKISDIECSDQSKIIDTIYSFTDF